MYNTIKKDVVKRKQETKSCVKVQVLVAAIINSVWHEHQLVWAARFLWTAELFPYISYGAKEAS